MMKNNHACLYSSDNKFNVYLYSKPRYTCVLDRYVTQFYENPTDLLDDETLRIVMPNVGEYYVPMRYTYQSYFKPKDYLPNKYFEWAPYLDKDWNGVPFRFDVLIFGDDRKNLNILDLAYYINYNIGTRLEKYYLPRTELIEEECLACTEVSEPKGIIDRIKNFFGLYNPMETHEFKKRTCLDISKINLDKLVHDYNRKFRANMSWKEIKEFDKLSYIMVFSMYFPSIESVTGINIYYSTGKSEE